MCVCVGLCVCVLVCVCVCVCVDVGLAGQKTRQNWKQTCRNEDAHVEDVAVIRLKYNYSNCKLQLCGLVMSERERGWLVLVARLGNTKKHKNEQPTNRPADCVLWR